jgi:hypothetical protein
MLRNISAAILRTTIKKLFTSFIDAGNIRTVFALNTAALPLPRTYYFCNQRITI